VDLLIGSNLNEVRMTAMMNGGPKKGVRNYWMLAAGNVGDRRQKKRIIERYRATMDNKAKYPVREQILADAVYTNSTHQIVDRQCKVRPAGTYRYRFDRQSPAHDGVFGAAHMMEIPFVFDNLEFWEELAGSVAEGQALADSMSAAWVNFARTGRPEAPGLPEWPTYDLVGRSTMLFDEVCRVENDPQSEQRRIWDEVA
jgi:para-nitrobenzyl esterase